jgi:hypothetical protein
MALQIPDHLLQRFPILDPTRLDLAHIMDGVFNQWYSPANTLIMRKPLIHNLLHDKDSSVQVVDIECLILNQNISG